MAKKDIRSDVVKQLEVKFYEVDSGWLRFTLKLGRQKFEGQFSDVFDPLDSFKKWLEAIAIGVEQCSFSYDPEGEEIKFNFENYIYDRVIFTVAENYPGGKVFINGKVERKQLVKAFYLGLFDFYNTPDFKSSEWEIEYIKERFLRALKISEKELINYLLELNRIELRDVFFAVDPVYQISFPTAKDKNEEFMLFVKDTADITDETTVHEKVKTPDYMIIPEDYDTWNKWQKTKFINECLNEKASGHDGMKITDFKSEIIEKFIGQYCNT